MINAKSSINKFSKGVALFSVNQAKPGMLLKKDPSNQKEGGPGVVKSTGDALETIVTKTAFKCFQTY